MSQNSDRIPGLRTTDKVMCKFAVKVAPFAHLNPFRLNPIPQLEMKPRRRIFLHLSSFGKNAREKVAFSFAS
jgi:hypothetical protein